MKKTLALIFLMGTFIGFAQNGSTGVKDQMFKINLLTPGIEYEIGLTSKTSVNLGLGTGFAITGGSDRDTEFGVYPIFNGSYRYYYNFDRRVRKNKRTDFNSANYFALTSSITSGDPIIGGLRINTDYSATVGPVWGFQRTYGSKLNINLELGVGYGFDNQDSFVTPIVGFSLGWVIGK